MSDECEFEVEQDDMIAAKGYGPHDAAVSQAVPYALMYGQDGPVQWRVYRISRSPSGRKKRAKILTGAFEMTSFSIG